MISPDHSPWRFLIGCGSTPARPSDKEPERASEHEDERAESSLPNVERGAGDERS